jgi:hypothetical protein
MMPATDPAVREICTKIALKEIAKPWVRKEEKSL